MVKSRDHKQKITVEKALKGIIFSGDGGMEAGETKVSSPLFITLSRGADVSRISAITNSPILIVEVREFIEVSQLGAEPAGGHHITPVSPHRHPRVQRQPQRLAVSHYV